MPHTHGCQVAEKMWRWRGDKRKRLKAIWTRMNADEHGLKNYNLVRLRRGKQKGERQAPAAG
jgi:hypothetical protein